MKQAVVQWLNELEAEDVRKEFLKCCGTKWWCEEMGDARPFADEAALKAAADRLFDQMTTEQWLEAFASHPKIGDLDSLRMKFAGNKQWSSAEQAGIQDTDEQVLADLAQGNETYEKRFGFIFIVCASGLSAEEMLARLQSRLTNDEHTELEIASGEQRKITHLRLDKLQPVGNGSNHTSGET